MQKKQFFKNCLGKLLLKIDNFVQLSTISDHDRKIYKTFGGKNSIQNKPLPISDFINLN